MTYRGRRNLWNVEALLPDYKLKPFIDEEQNPMSRLVLVCTPKNKNINGNFENLCYARSEPVCTTKINWLMILKKIIPVYGKNHTKHKHRILSY